MATTSLTQKRRIFILDVPVDVLQPEDIDEAVKSMVGSKEIHQIIMITLPDLMRARRNSEFLSCLSTASLVIPLSPSIVRGAKILNRSLPVRYMPFEFSIRLLGAIEKLQQTVYLIGQKQPELERIENNLKGSFPGIRIVGRCAGYFAKDRERDILLAIKKASPALLLAGYGLQGNNLWVFRHKKQFNPGIFFWCGNCFEIFSGKKNRPSKTLWNRGLDFIPELIRRPWVVLRIFLHIYYGILLVIYRLRRM